MKTFFVILFLIFLTPCVAQNTHRLNLVFTDSMQNAKLEQKLRDKNQFKSAQERNEQVRKVFKLLREEGFIAASADSILMDSLQQTLYLSVGKPYKWAKLKKGNVDEEALSAIGFRERFYFNQIFSAQDLSQVMDKLLVYHENNGYPFAEIKLDSIRIGAAEIEATLQMQKNQLCLIDSFIVKGNAKISPFFLQRQLGIRKGDKYNESRVLQISKRLREVPFLAERKVPEVYFSEKYTKLILYVDQKKANRFDGVLGFLPNENTGKLLITGQLTLKLSNSFNKGEVLDVDWQKLQARTQNLKSRLQIPFLFRSPFGADLNFKLYKRDTLFLDVSENVGINYLIGINNYFKLFFANRDISLISTRGLETATTLPQYADVNSKNYGIGFRTERVDYKFNPRKGLIFEVNGSAGTKTIKKNVKLKSVVYDSLDLKTNIYTIDFLVEYYLPIKRRSTILLGNKSALIESENIFLNETFRIGGLSSLRGFDEESINASFYSISKIEYRFLLDQNSFLFLFANHAYYQNKAMQSISKPESFIRDNPYGFGAGITFETKPGIFSLSYALGKQFNNPISLRGAKVHFGIVSAF
jgi:outer membrane protein assembly factor BamA